MITRTVLAELVDACTKYIDYYGLTHLDQCPEDDTCDCPFIMAMNRALLRANRALDENDNPYSGHHPSDVSGKPKE